MRLALAFGDEGLAPVDADAWITALLRAEQAGVDFVTIADTNGLDAIMLANRLAPATRAIGIVPVVPTAGTEPFLVSAQIATLDFASRGRAGWQPEPAELDEAADHIEVVRRLWDSWEDGAEVRDSAAGRFFDRDRVHCVDFHGPHFSVKGPSITPRPPQGQPIVAVDATSDTPLTFARATADVVFVAPHDDDELVSTLAAAGELLVFIDAASPTVEQLVDWHAAGVTGFRFSADDLPWLAGDLIAELRDRGVDRPRYASATLRGRLGLPRPANRYAAA